MESSILWPQAYEDASQQSRSKQAKIMLVFNDTFYGSILCFTIMDLSQYGYE